MTSFKVGKVTHYYDKIGVAIVDLQGSLAVGDKIKINQNSDSFEQLVTSMQIEHEQVQSAKSGQTIGLKVEKPVKKQVEVFKES